ncbi:hypothetical protein NTGM5_710010 [Candidatus Nitrotoga sp. M5]|nr:hypothetical protein NTGM5_710010 [Candidatus Nitrotoga sp. M5]
MFKKHLAEVVTASSDFYIRCFKRLVTGFPDAPHTDTYNLAEEPLLEKV